MDNRILRAWLNLKKLKMTYIELHQLFDNNHKKITSESWKYGTEIQEIFDIARNFIFWLFNIWIGFRYNWGQLQNGAAKINAKQWPIVIYWKWLMIEIYFGTVFSSCAIVPTAVAETNSKVFGQSATFPERKQHLRIYLKNNLWWQSYLESFSEQFQ